VVTQLETAAEEMVNDYSTDFFKELSEFGFLVTAL
jgi:hypothetical protein